MRTYLVVRYMAEEYEGYETLAVFLDEGKANNYAKYVDGPCSDVRVIQMETEDEFYENKSGGVLELGMTFVLSARDGHSWSKRLGRPEAKMSKYAKDEYDESEFGDCFGLCDDSDRKPFELLPRDVVNPWRLYAKRAIVDDGETLDWQIGVFEDAANAMCERICDMRSEGMTISEIADELGIHKGLI